MITYKTDKIKVEVNHNSEIGEYVIINDGYAFTYEDYKNLCQTYEHIEEMRKAVKK